jgi:cytochrome c oxidase subunit III
MTALDHGYVAEEHAPDPVIGHGDPTRPGKIGIWLFLASEIMFFIGILGTYIIYRSGAPALFAKHGETLSKSLAALNTVVLIFSSLTMAIAVDGAQKGDRKRVIIGLLVTLLCAATFMVVKTVEYTDKAHHHTIVASTNAQVTVKLDASAADDPKAQPYMTVTNPAKQYFNVSTGSFETMSNPRKWPSYVMPLQSGGEPGTFIGMISAAAAGPNKVNVYRQLKTEPHPKDKLVTPVALDYSGGVFVFDGHAHDKDDGTYAFTGWQAPFPSDAKAAAAIDIHLLAEADVRALPGSREVVQEILIDRARINSDINYGPWKNNFFASYFTLTGVHGIHVLAGMIPLTILLLQSLRGRLFPQHTEYVGLYWHFVDLVWIFLFPLLYLI